MKIELRKKFLSGTIDIREGYSDGSESRYGYGYGSGYVDGSFE